VLFLLFEMGLELSLDRLKVCSSRHVSTDYRVILILLQQRCHDSFNNHSICRCSFHFLNPYWSGFHSCITSSSEDMFCLQALAKFAFGLGTLQMLLCTLAFTLFALPVGNGIGTQILVKIFHAPGGLAAIRTVDEAVVIGAALSLSSSAFVLQLLSENGELSSKFGSATLGILLLQVSSH